MEAISLVDYINHECGGFNRIAAVDFGVSPSQITRWLKADVIVVNYKIYTKYSKSIRSK